MTTQQAVDGLTEANVNDPEIAAMHLIVEWFADLDPRARARVLRWLWDRYNLSEGS